MCQICSILIQNGLFIINFSSAFIGRRNLIFVPLDLSRRNEDFSTSYDPIAKNLIFSHLFGPQYHFYQQSGWFWFWCPFFICSTHKFSCPILKCIGTSMGSPGFIESNSPFARINDSMNDSLNFHVPFISLGLRI